MPIHFTEKRDIETALGIGSGYVLDFSNRTFAEFIAASIGIDIYGGPYSSSGRSKANHLRCFFEKAPDHMVGRLLTDLITHARQLGEDNVYSPPTEADLKRLDRCQTIAARLRSAQPVDNLDALRPNADDDKDFAVLAKIIREGIERHEPGPVLDRLHTFCIKYFWAICQKREIPFDKTDNLGNLAGKYVKYLERENTIEAKITVQIMRSSITTFSDFNYIRNNRSLAHDNQTLNDEEALLLFNNVANTLRFVEFLEARTPVKAAP
jgi:Abortive infection C-terminus